tara:strand:+ start:1345 stop:4500 length:3156 start_codon:yes stop_codon:yes gene_type:complete
MKSIIIQAREADSDNDRNGEYTSILKKPIIVETGDEVVVNNAFIDTRNISTDRIVIEKDTEIRLTANIYTYDNEIYVRRRYTVDYTDATKPILSNTKKWCGVWTDFSEDEVEIASMFFIQEIEIPILNGFDFTEEMNIQLRYFSFNSTPAFAGITPNYPYVPHYCVLKVPATRGVKSVKITFDDKLRGNRNYRSPADAEDPLIVGLIARQIDPLQPQAFFYPVEGEKQRYLENGLDINNITVSIKEPWNVGDTTAEAVETYIAGFANVEPNFTFTLPAKSYSPEEISDFISQKINEVRITEPTEIVSTATPEAGGVMNNSKISYIGDGKINYYDDLNWGGSPFFTSENNLLQFKLEIDDETKIDEFPFKPSTYEVGFCGDNVGFKFNLPENPTNYSNTAQPPPTGANPPIPDQRNFTSGRLIGASQVSLEYNNGFKWSFLHTPLYYQGDEVATYNNAMEWYIPDDRSPPQDGLKANDNDFYWLGGYSGVSWTHLEPASFWEDILGFDLHSLTFSPRYQNTNASREVIRTPSAPPVVLWTPTQLGAGVVEGWWDASETDTITLDGSNKVITWADRSVQGSDTSSPVVNRIGYTALALNSLGVMDFNGTDQYIEMTSFSNTQPYTLYTVMKNRSLTSTGAENILDGRGFIVETPWTPADWNGTKLWIDAGDTATHTVVGGYLVGISDKSGNGNTLTNTVGTTSQPTITTGGLNSKDVITFDGVNDFLQNTNNIVSAPFNIFVVGTNSGGSGRKYVFDGASNTGTPTPRALLALNETASTPAGNTVKVWAGGSATTGWGITGYNQPVDGTSWIMNSNYDGTTSNFYKNGVSIVSDYTIGDGGYTSGFTLGANWSATADFYGGDIAEIVIVEGTLRTQGREKVEGYLAHAWGLESELPAGHPYKTSAPIDSTTDDTARNFISLKNTTRFATGEIAMNAGTRQLSAIGTADTLDWNVGAYQFGSVAPIDSLIYFNGDTATQLGDTGTNNLQAGITTGCNYDKTGDFFDGQIAEYLICDGVQSTADRQKIEGYLAWKWGIESVLPVGHPYKSAPPEV